MAIDYGNYAQLQAQSVDFSPLQQGVQSYIAKSDEMRQIGVRNLQDEMWAKTMKPFQDAAHSDVTKWNPETFVGLDAGTALLRFKNAARAMGNRYYNTAAAQGMFNPIAFKQQFDQMKASYMPSLEAKLAQYRDTNNLSDRQLQQFISVNPELQSFMLDNADPVGEIRELSKPFKALGTWGGTKAAFMEAPGVATMGIAGPGIIGAGIGASKAAKGARMGEAMKGFKGAWSLRGGSGRPSRGRIKALRAMAKANPELSGIPEDLAKNQKKTTKTNRDLKKARKLRDAAVKKHEAKVLKGVNRTYNPKTDLYDYDSPKDAAKLRENIRKHGSVGEIKENQTVKDLKAEKAKLKGQRTTLKAGSKEKGALKTIRSYVKKHGRKKLISTLAKKVGWKRAVLLGARLLGGGLLTGTGVGTAFGVASIGYTLYEIHNLLKEGSKEATGTGPYGFGGPGGKPTEGAATYRLGS